MAASEPFQPAAFRRVPVGARLPIVERVPTRVRPAERWRIRRIAERIRREWPGGGLNAVPAGDMEPGLLNAPALHIHDLQPVLAPSEPYWNASEYRALLMANPGDVIALWTRRVPAFEGYCRDVLGIVNVETIHVMRPDDVTIPLTVQCRRDPGVLSRLVRFASDAGGLNLMPYIGSESAWSLAAAIARRADVPVRVTAPRPRLTRAVNNKLWFTEVVSEILGEDSVPTTASVHDRRVLISVLRGLARQNERVVLKLPNASAGTGNLVVETDPIRRVSWKALDNALGSLFRGLHWQRPFPLLVSSWERPVVVTPSVQLWVPERHRGSPVVEGIFAQEVAGPVAEFMGAAPADLPANWERRLASEAAKIGSLFQELDYFGRCSLDAILIGHSLDRAELNWVECNGRWGGTSIPMTVVNRLADHGEYFPFVVAYDIQWRDFAAVLSRTRNLLFRPGRRTGVVYLSPGNREAGRGIDFLAIGRSPEDATRRVREVRDRLAG